MVASQKLAWGDFVNVVVCRCGGVLRSKSVGELNLLPTNGLEPASLTSEALVAQYLHMVSAYLNNVSYAINHSDCPHPTA